MTDTTKLMKAKNNLLEFIEDEKSDIFMLLRTEEHQTPKNPPTLEEYIEMEEKIKKESKELSEAISKTTDEKEMQQLMAKQAKGLIYQNLGRYKNDRLLLNDNGIKFILDNDEEINDINNNKLYSSLIKRYAQKLEFPWDGGLDENGDIYPSFNKYPKLRSEVVNFISLLKQYLLVSMKEKYNILTLDIIPDSQNTLLAIFTLGNKVNEQITKEANEFFQKKLEDIFENPFIDKTSEHYLLRIKGLGISEIAQVKEFTNSGGIHSELEIMEHIREHRKKEYLKDVKFYTDMLKDARGENNLQLKDIKKWIENLIETMKIDLELQEFEDEVYKGEHLQCKKLIKNNELTLDALLQIDYESEKAIKEHPLRVQKYGREIIEKKFDPNIKIKTVFIERSKRMRFETVAEKRLNNIEKSIATFNNFLSKTNVANYDFSKDDMIGIDERITKAVNTFRLNYEQFFASNPDKTVNKNSKIEKFKKNIDGTDPLIIKNIKDNMKGGD